MESSSFTDLRTQMLHRSLPCQPQARRTSSQKLVFDYLPIKISLWSFMPYRLLKVQDKIPCISYSFKSSHTSLFTLNFLGGKQSTICLEEMRCSQKCNCSEAQLSKQLQKLNVLSITLILLEVKILIFTSLLMIFLLYYRNKCFGNVFKLP